jgi:hypothetical protein
MHSANPRKLKRSSKMQNVGKPAAVSVSDVDAPVDIFDVDNDTVR